MILSFFKKNFFFLKQWIRNLTLPAQIEKAKQSRNKAKQKKSPNDNVPVLKTLKADLLKTLMKQFGLTPTNKMSKERMAQLISSKINEE